MKITVPSGKYSLAVSGGVDSMVLLHVLAAQPGVELIVAHFEHGIRPDSDEDRLFVGQTAKKLGLPFVYERGNLGPDASEAAAREARYRFLEKVRAEQGAAAIITAHHQDDLLETAIINMLRGTGRKGLTALADNQQVLRPLLYISKQEVVTYAKEQGIEWREDSTNSDDRYLRNYIRHYVMAKLTQLQRDTLLEHIHNQRDLNIEINNLLMDALKANIAGEREVDRAWFISLPHAVAAEAMAAWLRLYDIRGFDRRTIERLVVAAKTAQPGKIIDIQSGCRLQISRNTLRLL